MSECYCTSCGTGGQSAVGVSLLGLRRGSMGIDGGGKDRHSVLDPVADDVADVSHVQRVPGTFNQYGSEGPYGCAMHSRPTDFAHLTTQPVILQTKSRSEVISIGFDTEAAAVMNTWHILAAVQRGEIFVPFASPGILDCLGDTAAATPQQCTMGGFGLATGVCSISNPGRVPCQTILRSESDGQLMRVTAILYIPKIIEKLYHGQNPAGIDTKLLKWLADGGQTIPVPCEGGSPYYSNVSSCSDEGPLCVICQEFPPQFW